MANAFDEKILGERQKIALAQKLRESGQEIPQGRMVGDRFVGASWTQGLAQALKQGLGAYDESQAENKIKDIQNERLKEVISARAGLGIPSSQKDLEAVGTPAEAPSVFRKIGGALGIIDKPETIPAIPMQQPQIADYANLPEGQQNAAMMSAVNVIPNEATAMMALNEHAANRKAAAQKIIDDNEARKELKLADIASRESMTKDTNEIRREIAQLATSNRQGPHDPMVSVINPITGLPENRRESTTQGMMPGSTYKPPAAMTVAREKMIYSNDDLIESNKAAIKNLNEALVLNPKAYEGAFSNTKALLESNNPFASEADKAKANDTVAFDNIVRNNAVTQLKAIFAGNPTEGERKVLLELAASADKTASQRKDILERGIAAAEKRLQQYTGRGKGLRSGEFFVPEESDPFAGFTEADKAAFQKEHGGPK